MTDIAYLISRLREKRARGRPGFYNPDELCLEAASALERAYAEPTMEEAGLVVDSYDATVNNEDDDEDRAILSAMRAALRSFLDRRRTSP